jgi:hypothetical protein
MSNLGAPAPTPSSAGGRRGSAAAPGSPSSGPLASPSAGSAAGVVPPLKDGQLLLDLSEAPESRNPGDERISKPAIVQQKGQNMFKVTASSSSLLYVTFNERSVCMYNCR